MDLIERLSDTGKTIVHAIHDLVALYRIADRCLPCLRNADRAGTKKPPGTRMTLIPGGYARHGGR